MANPADGHKGHGTGGSSARADGPQHNLRRVVHRHSDSAQVVAATTLRRGRALPMATDCWQDSFERGTGGGANLGVRRRGRSVGDAAPTLRPPRTRILGLERGLRRPCDCDGLPPQYVRRLPPTLGVCARPAGVAARAAESMRRARFAVLGLGVVLLAHRVTPTPGAA
jgi:hypothetical protein